MNVFIFYLICFIGWKCFAKMKVPAPTILGPIFAIGAVNYFGFDYASPVWLKPCLSVILGTFLGLRFNLKLKGMLKEILIVCSWIVTISFITGHFLSFIGVQKATAVFASQPGGLAELALVAMSFGANTFEVALLMTTRLLCTMLVVTTITKRIRIPEEKHEGKEKEKAKKPGNFDWVMICLIALFSAFSLSFTNLPAASLIGPMLAVGLYIKANSISTKGNKALQEYAQIGVGGIIGLNVTRESILAVPDFLLPIIILNLLIVGGGLLIGYVLHRITEWDLVTCLLATAPAGLTPIAMLTMELGANTTCVMLFQMIRLMTVVLWAPFIGQMLLSP